VRLRKVGSREAGLPPGPPTVPLLGNLHMMPTEFAQHKCVPLQDSFLALRSLSRFTEWARKYGGIYSVSANSYGCLERIIYSSLQLKVGSGTAVVLTDPAAVKELMDKRSGSTVERPPSHVAELVTGGLNMVCANF
jgi:hypothetical protein